MNSFLKALIQEIYDLEQGVEAAVGKQWALVVQAAIKCGMDLPALIQNVSSAKPDLEALMSNPVADADLLAFAGGLLKDQTKAEKAIVLAADLALSGLQLEPKVLALVAVIKS